jgi:hypothetical protein
LPAQQVTHVWIVIGDENFLHGVSFIASITEAYSDASRTQRIRGQFQVKPFALACTMILNTPSAEGHRMRIRVLPFTVSKVRPVLAFSAEVPYIFVRQFSIKSSHIEHANS